MADSLDVLVAAIAIGKSLDFLDDIALGRVQDYVSAEFLSLCQTIVAKVQNDQLLRVLHPCVGDHALSEGSCSGDDDNVFIGNLSSVDRMLCAAVRFDQGCLLDRQLFRNTGDMSGLVIADILSHAAVVLLLIAVHTVRFAHPVSSGLAELALSAGSDLISRDTVADLVIGNVLSDFRDSSEELMSRDERRLDPRIEHRSAPLTLRSLIALDIADADAAGLGLDDDVIVAALRCRVSRFKAVISLAVAYKGFHSLGNCHSETSFSYGYNSGRSTWSCCSVFAAAGSSQAFLESLMTFQLLAGSKLTSLPSSILLLLQRTGATVSGCSSVLTALRSSPVRRICSVTSYPSNCLTSISML